MPDNAENGTVESLSLCDELIIMLLNEQSGYFYQVPGWELNCTFAGAVLAELSLLSRIDTDMTSLLVVDRTETGNPILDPMLRRIMDEPVQRNARYWIECFATEAEPIIDMTLDRLVGMGILEHHDGEFWTLVPNYRHANPARDSEKGGGTASKFIKTRIREAIFTDTIPDSRDIIIVCLVNTCDVFRFIYELDDKAEERIRLICQMDLISRSITDAVEHKIASPMLRRSHLARQLPSVSLSRLPFNRNFRQGNVPALFSDLAKEYGPVFRIKLPFAKPIIFLAGPQTNFWVHRRGRRHLRARDYFSDLEQMYGACGVLPSLDGAEHFRLRKAISPAYSRSRLEVQLDRFYHYAYQFMSEWKVGAAYPATPLSRRMINAQLSPLSISVETQDIIDDLILFKERALTTHVAKILPKFMLWTPKMKRKARVIDTLMKRVQSVHTPAQRAGCPRNLADDWLSLHSSDPLLVPESNLRFAISTSLLASYYLGDAFSFVLYAMASQPEILERIQVEADALFDGGNPESGDYSPTATDVTRRFIMECLRMYPIVPVSLRDVMNSCEVEGYEIPYGSRVFIAQTAAHYMEDVFPDPYRFDIDRYLPSRAEHRSPGYAPYGLGTHTCLGTRWLDLQLAINVLIVARYFVIRVSPRNYKLRFHPIPSMKPSRKLKILIAEQRHELPG